MAHRSLSPIFQYVEPFRHTLLTMLLPFDIAKLLVALECSLSPWEEKVHMDVMDDILKDKKDVEIMTSQNITVRFFGSDLSLLQWRLQDPCEFIAQYGHDYQFHVFVVATGRGPAPFHDFRPGPHRAFGPEDEKSIDELYQEFPEETARGIVTASQWMLCAPYVSNSRPSDSGWIPIFNSQKYVSIRTYFPTGDTYSHPVLWMKGELFCRVFGFEQKMKIDKYMSKLWTRVIVMQKGERPIVSNVKAKLQRNLLQNIAEMYLEPGQEGIVVVQAVHPLDLGITVDIT